MALVLTVLPALGAQTQQLCLSCHESHYVQRGGCSLCHRGNPASKRRNIAHSGVRAGKYVRYTLGNEPERKEGERLIEQLACRRCHVSGGRGNRLAISLDATAGRRTVGELVLSIRRPVVTMPNFNLNEEQMTRLVNVILAGSEGRETDIAAPMKVYFKISGKKSVDIFSEKCGGCHRILSQSLGALGAGETGPNLSGLLSAFYPKSFRNGDEWSLPNLKGWLKNPRETKAWARMQPVAVTEEEIKKIGGILLVSPESKI